MQKPWIILLYLQPTEQTEENWKEIFESNTERQIEIGIVVKERYILRQEI